MKLKVVYDKIIQIIEILTKLSALPWMHRRFKNIRQTKTINRLEKYYRKCQAIKILIKTLTKTSIKMHSLNHRAK